MPKYSFKTRLYPYNCFIIVRLYPYYCNLILHYNTSFVIMHITINYKVVDITKCKGVNCPIKDECKRYTTKESFLQSYFMESPIKDNKCDMYWGEDSENIFNHLKTILKL